MFQPSSKHFLSAAAGGEDWREAAKKLLNQIEQAKDKEQDFTLGFLYITDHLAKDASGILNLLRSVLKIENWVGTTGIGICGTGRSFIDKPALSVLLMNIPPEHFCLFPDTGKPDVGKTAKFSHKNLEQWIEKTPPMLVYIHGHNAQNVNMANVLHEFGHLAGGFLVGGLASSRHAYTQFAGAEVQDSMLSGVAFSRDIKVATALSQGCTPIGGAHTITKGDDNLVHELDSQCAADVFEQDIHTMIIKKINKDPDEIYVDEEALENPEAIPAEFQNLLKGEIHAGFPLPGSDQNDFLVRPIIGMDPDEGTIGLSQMIATGERMLFVHRDEETARRELSETLVNLRTRIKKDTGAFRPKAGLYVSCIARLGSSGYSDILDETALIREIIGDIPLAGFYANGEINNARLYGYTGILTLFL